MCPGGQHPVRSVAGGMGRSQAQTRGVPTRIQPIACSGAAGAAPSPVVVEGGNYAPAREPEIATRTPAPGRPDSSPPPARPRPHALRTHRSTRAGHSSSGLSVHPSADADTCSSPSAAAVAAPAVRWCRCRLRARFLCPLLILATQPPLCSPPPPSTPLPPLLLLASPRRQSSVRACVAPDLRRCCVRCSPPCRLFLLSLLPSCPRRCLV